MIFQKKFGSSRPWGNVCLTSDWQFLKTAMKINVYLPCIFLISTLSCFSAAAIHSQCTEVEDALALLLNACEGLETENSIAGLLQKRIDEEKMKQKEHELLIGMWYCVLEVF